MPWGMFFVTTLPAPMTDFEPNFTPGQIIAPPPTRISDPIQWIVESPGQHLVFFGAHKSYFRFAAAFSLSCFTRSFTIRSMRSMGIGSLSGN